MKKIVLSMMFFALVIVASACSDESTAEERFTEFVKLWNDQKFEEMYSYLSSESQKAIKKDEFIERYSKIYDDLEISDLKVTAKKIEDEPEGDKEIRPFSVKMDSLAGEISFDNEATLVKENREEEEDWYINWNTTFIFKDLEEGDKVGISTDRAIRGEIKDKNGVGLAVNGTAVEIGIIPGNMEGDKESIIAEVSELLEMQPEQIEKELNASWVQDDYFVPIKKITNNRTELVEQLLAIPSVTKKDVQAREYPLEAAAAHLIGNVGVITGEELEKRSGQGYTSTDVIGKRGLEQVLEERLKGHHGAAIYIEKADETKVELAKKEVKHGEDIQLTIDATVQKEIYKQFGNDAGTAAAMNPVTGETIALVNSPGFDPNQASLGLSSARLAALEEDERQPMLNRFKSSFAPGSVLKPITAAIALENGVTDWNKSMNVSGLKWQKDESWGAYSVTRVKDPKGPVNLEKALLYSDNIYFAQEGLALGKDSFAKGLDSFGFNQEIPYIFPIEESTYGNMDSEGALADSSFGQGQVEMSVIHLASTYTTFVNKGNMIKPILLAEEETSQVWAEKVVNENDAEKLNQALRKVVQDPGGTAYGSARMEKLSIAGKTGTAELKKSLEDQEGKENGWFVGYNTDNPDLLIALMVEDVKERGGSKTAAEKVKKVFQQVK